MKVPVVPGGTRDKPTLVPSMFEERIVGCICEFLVFVLIPTNVEFYTYTGTF